MIARLPVSIDPLQAPKADKLTCKLHLQKTAVLTSLFHVVRAICGVTSTAAIDFDALPPIATSAYATAMAFEVLIVLASSTAK
jgi:hypothetical protein